MSKMNLLLDESPIVFQGRLAKLIGLSEAIVLQTLQYYCNNKKCGKMVDGKRWIYNTYEEWQELSFPFWTPRAIAETFRTLEKMGFVASEKFDKLDGVNRKYYTVTDAAKAFLTTDKITHLEETSSCPPMRKKLPDDKEETSRSARARHIKEYTENHSENQKASDIALPSESSDQSSTLPTESAKCAPDQEGKAAGADIQTLPNAAGPLPTEEDAILERNRGYINQMFHRKESTVWKKEENKKLKDTLKTTDEEWEAMLDYYKHEGDPGYYCRTKIETLLNNWDIDVEKAMRAKRVKPKVYSNSDKPQVSAISTKSKLQSQLVGREDEFWAWLKAWRPWEEKRPLRAIPDEWAWDFLNGKVHEPIEPLTEFKLPKEEELF